MRLRIWAPALILALVLLSVLVGCGNGSDLSTRSGQAQALDLLPPELPVTSSFSGDTFSGS